jgi:hypothetical protein
VSASYGFEDATGEAPPIKRVEHLAASPAARGRATIHTLMAQPSFSAEVRPQVKSKAAN